MSIFFKNLPQLYQIKISFMEMFDSLITADFFTASHLIADYKTQSLSSKFLCM